MDDINRFTLMIDALTELAKEDQTHQTAPKTVLPTLDSVLAEISPLPSEALFLGLAEDGLPVLLNLQDPIPGPILITGDQSSGKTTLLQVIARALEIIHSPLNVQYSVITQYPEEWNNFQHVENNLGIYTTQDNGTQELIHSLVEWAHTNRNDGRSLLLLIDDLEFPTNLDQQTGQDLRWLLLRGTSRHIWPIVTLNTGRAQQVEDWLGFFRTRLFGNIQSPEDSRIVSNVTDNPFNELLAGTQFAMREGKGWIKFIAPNID